jgi:hypothetical protein
MNIYQITTRPRHFRHIFFIDEQYPYDELLKLILKNQGHWGGRYDPIVPVSENKISAGYLQIIKHYDPDHVFYSHGIDPKMLKTLRMFNPAGYYDLDASPPQKDISGISTFYLLDGKDSSAKVLLPLGIWKHESTLADYYHLNFGLNTIPYTHEYEMSKKYRQLVIDAEKFKELNKIIHEEKPLNIAALSRLKVNTSILRNLQYAQYEDFELVVAKDKTTITDLLYYWNRGLYQHKRLPGIEIEAVAKELNPVLQGWINYYGKFYKTKLKGFMRGINAKLANWAIRKYKKIRVSLTSGMKWVSRLCEKQPNLFAHWTFGSKPVYR